MYTTIIERQKADPIKLLIRARMWIADELQEREADENDSQLVRSIDRHLLRELGAEQMIDAFGSEVGYHDDPETKAKRRKWRDVAAASAMNLVREYAIEAED